MTKYEMSPADKTRLDNTYTYHSPKDDQPARYGEIRAKAKELAAVLLENCPRSRELSHALTLLEDAVMNANAAIARNE